MTSLYHQSRDGLPVLLTRSIQVPVWALPNLSQAHTLGSLYITILSACYLSFQRALHHCLLPTCLRSFLLSLRPFPSTHKQVEIYPTLKNDTLTLTTNALQLTPYGSASFIEKLLQGAFSTLSLAILFLSWIRHISSLTTAWSWLFHTAH